MSTEFTTANKRQIQTLRRKLNAIRRRQTASHRARKFIERRIKARLASYRVKKDGE